VVRRGNGFDVVWRFQEEEAAPGNHCTQSPASEKVASPGHALGHCNVKCTLCSGQVVWRSKHWGLCLAVQVACEASSGFFTFWSPSVMEPLLGNHCAQSPASVWVSSPEHALGHCKVKCTLCMQWSVGLAEPELGGCARLCRWLARLLQVLSHSGVLQ